MPPLFSKREALRFGWNKTKAHLRFLLPLLALVAVLSITPGVIGELFKEKIPALGFIGSILGWFLGIIVDIGLIHISLKLADNKEPAFYDLFSEGSRLFFKYIAASLLYGLIVLGGLIALIVPGIIFAIKFQFFAYLIVDKGLGPIEALKKSSLLTKGIKKELFFFNLLLVGLNIAGALALLVGLFLTIPISLLASAFVYKKLLTRNQALKNPRDGRIYYRI